MLEAIADCEIQRPSCARCRHHKIKCTGDHPCSTCIQRRTTCVFQDDEEKVRITKKRLSELNRRTCELENENNALQQRLSGRIEAPATPELSSRQTSPMNQVTARGIQDASTNRFVESRDDYEDDDTGMVNPLSCGSPKYITDIAGKPRELLCPVRTSKLLTSIARLSWKYINVVPYYTTPTLDAPGPVQVPVSKCGPSRRLHDLRSPMEWPAESGHSRYPRSSFA